MRRFLGAALAAALCLSIIAPVAAAPAPDVAGSIILTYPDPVFGGTVTFTETYPQDAAKQSRHTQYPGSPQTQLNCYQDGTPVYRELAFPDQREKIPGGWLATTNPLTLLGKYPGGATWTSGAAWCVAVLFSNDAKGAQHIWAVMAFDVGA